jgi:hypothetical protein
VHPTEGQHGTIPPTCTTNSDLSLKWLCVTVSLVSCCVLSLFGFLVQSSPPLLSWCTAFIPSFHEEGYGSDYLENWRKHHFINPKPTIRFSV